MSKNKKELFRGAATAIITPFSGENIDYKALGSLMDFQIDGGIDTIVVAGTTGEAPTLSYGELEELFRFSVAHTKGRAKIIAGCGCNCTERSVEIAKTARECGCHGLLAVAPYYNRPTAVGLTEHYTKIADTSELPLILYNVPSRTGVNIGLEVYRALASHPNIVGIKEASGSIAVAEDILSEFGDDFDLYSGNDDMTLPIMALGGKGCISVVSNLLPSETQALCRMCLEQNFTRAAELQLDLIPIIRALFSETNPIPIKYALSRLGFCDLSYRLPLCPPTPQTAGLLDMILEVL
ncbi:MAG: 4-hydroxy-tetrahydrodipicolinate synthase [Clostridia bacterium]|nr:4-hydroxy-tetrahydrodipicolinate synthase [Clostridia bacterium]